jgi:hypothetical protein
MRSLPLVLFVAVSNRTLRITLAGQVPLELRKVFTTRSTGAHAQRRGLGDGLTAAMTSCGAASDASVSQPLSDLVHTTCWRYLISGCCVLIPLRRPIRVGTRLALQLSPRGSDGFRTLRFFIDKHPAAVYAEIPDDDGTEPWVAGLTLPRGCAARIVTPHGVEFWRSTVRCHATQMATFDDG